MAVNVWWRNIAQLIEERRQKEKERKGSGY
jgi:hypothetical protein